MRPLAPLLRAASIGSCKKIRSGFFDKRNRKIERLARIEITDDFIQEADTGLVGEEPLFGHIENSIAA
jgi:hypothetical protein